MSAAPKPWIAVTPQIMGKTALATVLLSSGMFYLATGRRDADVSRMITGAFFALASCFIFVL